MEVDEKIISPLPDLADLEEKGHRIVESLAGDVTPTDKTRVLLERFQAEKRESFYGDIIYYLTSEKYPEAQAAALWKEIVDHKFLMSERLGRNAGIRVAAIDYLMNVRKLVIAPRLISAADFRNTLRLSRTDPLTGLYNRRYFLDQAARLLEAAGRLKAPVTVLMTDLDNFKSFNDTHGHQAGDLLLQEIARLIRGCVRVSDITARYGGDEMALVLPKAGKKESAAAAEKIRLQIEENCRDVGVTISVGLAEFPQDAGNRDDLIAAADEVLYRAKEFGGNKVCLFQPVNFQFKSGDAGVQRVSVVGDFNNWNKGAHPLQPMSGGHEWRAAVPVKPGRYRYKFVLNDAEWIPDPKCIYSESDGFGGRCSVLVVK